MAIQPKLLALYSSNMAQNYLQAVYFLIHKVTDHFLAFFYTKVHNLCNTSSHQIWHSQNWLTGGLMAIQPELLGLYSFNMAQYHP